MDQNKENVDFHTSFTVTFTPMVSTEMKTVIFEFLVHF